MSGPPPGGAPPHTDITGAPLPALPTIGDGALRNPPQAGAARRWMDATVVDVRRENASTSTFRLELPRWEAHLPGQHYVVRLAAADGYRAERSYSVASPPEDAGHVELTIERLAEGEVSTYLHDHLGVGDTVTVRGPFGGWFVWRGTRPALLVGGGSGVVPLMAMVRHARAARAAGRDVAPVRAVFSFRDGEHALFADAWGEECSAVLTRATSSAGRPAGRLTARDLAPALEEVAAAAGSRPGGEGLEVFVCGGAPFAATAERLLTELGSPPSALHVERFGPSGTAT